MTFKVAIVIDCFGRGGSERQALYCARVLARAGFSVELIHYYDAPNSYDSALADGARVTYLPRNNDTLRFLWRLRRHLKRGGFDIVHAFKSAPCVYGCLAGVLAGVPVVLGGYREQYRCRGLLRLAHRVVNRCISGWITNSRAISDSLVRGVGADPERLRVVYNGIDRDMFVSRFSPREAKRRLGLDGDTPVVSIIGRLRPEKNHAMFVEMAGRVLATRGKVRFLIAGDGLLEDELKELTVSLGVDHAVHFLGVRSDIADILAATDVCVITSPREGLANSLVEAMSVGVPVISTEYPGVEEVIENNQEGFVVPQSDVDRMASAVVRLLDDEALRERMGKKGEERVGRQFGMEAMANSLIAVYRQFLERTRS